MTAIAFSSTTAPGNTIGDGFACYDAVASPGDNGSGVVLGSQASGVQSVDPPAVNDRVYRMWPPVS